MIVSTAARARLKAPDGLHDVAIMMILNLDAGRLDMERVCGIVFQTIV